MHQDYWLAFRVPPQKERTAELLARKRGFHAVVPLEQRTKRRTRGDKKRFTVSYPMINGYVFIKFNGPCDWMRLADIKLIRSVVGFNDVPAAISPDSMDRLLKISGGSVPHIKSENMRHGFVEGDTVEIISGPLQSTLVRVEKIIGQKAKVVFKMLGVEEIEIPIENLDAA